MARGVNTRWYREVFRPMVFARAPKDVRSGAALCQVRCPGEWPVKGKMARCAVIADCVHHTQGVGRTGHDLRYAVASCTPCNAHVGEPSRAQKPLPFFPSSTPRT